MKRLLAAAVFAALLTAAACGSSGGETIGAGGRPPSANAPSVNASVSGEVGMVGEDHGRATITIKDFGYTGDLTVEPGADVTVVNKDPRSQTLTDDDKMFDTGVIHAGATGSFVAPMRPGKYPFGCTLHPEMSGVLTVTG
jgi:plastocyanin